jgi:type I restriction enzyme M protein
MAFFEISLRPFGDSVPSSYPCLITVWANLIVYSLQKAAYAKYTHVGLSNLLLESVPMLANHTEVEKRLWEAADELRANSKLKSSEYSVPVLGLIFLRYADQKFSEAEKKLTAAGSGRRKIGKTDYQAQGVLYIPEKARFANLLNLPEGADIGKAINEAMKSIEAENEDLKDVLPKTYNALEKGLLVSLLKNFSAIPITEGDAFGRIYEYFLGKFAMAEGQKGGEFFTPISIVKLIVEIIEPYHGRILDPACGSGGMFVQSAAFVAHHKKNVNEISIYGQEKVAETIRLCKMNLAVHGLSGDIRQSNTYYEDPHKSVGKFDFVMANPPFNVDKVDKERIKNDPRYPFELPKADNANYLWIQIFYSTLSATGRAGFVMANSAGDARGSELEIRKKLLQSHAVDVVVSIGPNFFYTVTLPCTLWFLDRGKARTDRKKKVLFIDARRVFTQIDRAHREFTPKQIEFISNIVRLYRGEEPEGDAGSGDLMQESFPKGNYVDVLGLCRVSTLEETETQAWSLNPGRYVGVAPGAAVSDEDFKERLERLDEELEALNAQARELEQKIAANVSEILGA